MKSITKNKLLISALFIAFVVMLLCGFAFTFNVKAYAAGIDYENQNYQDLPSSFNCATEDVIYKIHCDDIRTKHSLTDVEDYVTKISFRASMGCQIYFVNGKACNLEDSSYGDNVTTKYENYYEILHYDSENKYVYIKFKNLSSLDADETVDASLEDVGIWQVNNTYLNAPQYIYLSNVTTPVTEITNADAYFSSEVKAAHGGRGFTNYNIYSIEYTIKLNQKVAHLVDKIDVSFVDGGDNFTLYKSSFSVSDGQGDENGYIDFTIITLGGIDDAAEKVQLQAKITYGEKALTITSAESDLVTLWNGMVNNNFADSDYAKYMTENNKTHIRKLVKTYNAGFYEEIKGSQNYFADYDKKTDIKLTSLIFKVPIENLSYANFGWSSSYYQGYTYYVSARIDGNLYLTTTAYKMKTNEDGTVTVAEGDIIYDTSVSQKIYDSIDYFAYNGSLYVRIKDDTPVTSYFPQKATRSFGAYASDKSYNSVTLQTNTATIIYDEYNKELLAQIESLKAQLTELQKQLESANALSESQREKINVLQSSLDGLTADYETAQAEIAYMTEQIEVMREEYQKKIDQLIAENGNKESVPDNGGDTDDTDTEENEVQIEQIVALAAGILFIVVIISLLIPKRRR